MMALRWEVKWDHSQRPTDWVWLKWHIYLVGPYLFRIRLLLPSQGSICQSGLHIFFFMMLHIFCPFTFKYKVVVPTRVNAMDSRQSKIGLRWRWGEVTLHFFKSINLENQKAVNDENLLIKLKLSIMYINLPNYEKDYIAWSFLKAITISTGVRWSYGEILCQLAPRITPKSKTHQPRKVAALWTPRRDGTYPHQKRKLNTIWPKLDFVTNLNLQTGLFLTEQHQQPLSRTGWPDLPRRC